ncbi:uncharacterized protein ColSpa_08982 [Colletotrichum spaethianum]|uniref:Uncharacterized protein n=1 Tax=Colletotrichum spaethianum TaxID=700344 RepID=A0AA37PAQ6_9PEZI|nr:uncharacterized protein ColSpa_08982 [Colletotrichum spaethianum]GKT48801.1 hypothetical protein ColSpa_08982 [Colletotrichum spaethianum]
MEYKPYCARTSEDLRIASKQHGDKSVIWQLDRDDLVSSASRWNLRHTIAYRLLVQPEAVFLPILATDHALRCPICSAEDRPLTQKLNPIGTQNLTGENPRDLRMMTESDLMRLPEGFFWAALARAIRPEITDEDRVYPQRERRPVRREGYMNSAMAIVGSSSPPLPPSSSEFEVEVEGLDQDEHEDRRSKPEEVTVHLVTAFLQFALNLCFCQHTIGIITDSEVRTRVERRKTKTFISGMIPVAAEDDGASVSCVAGRWGGR